MKAIVYRRYGSPARLRLEDVDAPVIGDDEVLVRVQAASVNPLDWHFLRGHPYFVRTQIGLRRPKRNIPGVDLAGRVESVGRNVTEFHSGDEVIGHRSRACAELVRARPEDLVLKPARLTFEQAAAVPAAGLTALQALRDKGGLQPGQRVLINGASGGVGTFAVQIAKALGADVTGVCSTANLELVRSIGANRVVDYTRDDFTRSGDRYDVVLDNAGNRSIGDLRRVLGPTGTLVLVGASDSRLFMLHMLANVVEARMVSREGGQRVRSHLTEGTKADLIALRELLEAGTVTPVIDRTYRLAETADALRYLETGHARAKVVVRV